VIVTSSSGSSPWDSTAEQIRHHAGIVRVEGFAYLRMNLPTV
jgi:hypothetical protein